MNRFDQLLVYRLELKIRRRLITTTAILVGPKDWTDWGW
jgi:hypothetical protein